MIVFQIYYDKNSRANIIEDDSVIPVYNYANAKPYYENKVISSIIPRLKDDEELAGVFSHKFKQKINVPLEAFKYDESDIVTFFGASRGDYWKNFERWHSGGIEAMSIICDGIGLDFNPSKNPKVIVYQNHFLAKGKIYKDYVINYLRHAMNMMNDKSIIRLQNLINKKTTIGRYRNDTMHTFLLERLFSVYLENNNFKVKQFSNLYKM